MKTFISLIIIFILSIFNVVVPKNNWLEKYLGKISDNNKTIIIKPDNVRKTCSIYS